MLNHANSPQMFSIESWQKAIITFGIVRTTAHKQNRLTEFLFGLFLLHSIFFLQFLIRSFNSIHPFANLFLVYNVCGCVGLRADFVHVFVTFYHKVDAYISIRAENSCINVVYIFHVCMYSTWLYANVSSFCEASLVVQSSSHIINYLINLNSIYIYRIHARLIQNVDPESCTKPSTFTKDK